MELTTRQYVIGQRDFVLTLDPVAGMWPVTLSVPHDTLSGYELQGLVPERARGVRGKDKLVWPVVRDVVIQTPAAVVRGLLPRSICDYNRAEPPGVCYDFYGSREPDAAYESPAVAVLWRAYHEAISRRLTLARRAGLRPLLLDMHGFGRPAPYGEFDLILGTGNRASVGSDVDLRLGEHLSRAGYRVFVPKERPRVPGVDDYLDAEHTVRWHAVSDGVDAIQIELSRRFRVPEAGAEGRRLSACLAEFLIGL